MFCFKIIVLAVCLILDQRALLAGRAMIYMIWLNIVTSREGAEIAIGGRCVCVSLRIVSVNCGQIGWIANKRRAQ